MMTTNTGNDPGNDTRMTHIANCYCHNTSAQLQSQLGDDHLIKPKRKEKKSACQVNPTGSVLNASAMKTDTSHSPHERWHKHSAPVKYLNLKM